MCRRSWKTIINKALEKDRNLRYQHASEMRADLQRLKRDSDSVRVPAATIAAATSPLRIWKLISQRPSWCLAVGGYFYLHRTPKLSDKDTVVLADFANSTGDPIFDDTLKTALSVSLRQSPFLNVLSDGQGRDDLAAMTRPASTKLTPEVARELCQRAGSKAYIAGSIGSLGSEYVLGLKGGELPERRHAGRGAGDGGVQGESAGRAGRGGIEAARRTGRIAGDGAEVRCSAGRKPLRRRWKL